MERTKFATSYDQRIHLLLAGRMAEMGLWQDALREGRMGMQRISQPPALEFWRRLQAAYDVRHDPRRKVQALVSLAEPLRQLGS